MNNPAKLNGWTLAMLHRMFAVFDDLAKDADTKVLFIVNMTLNCYLLELQTKAIRRFAKISQ